MFTPFRLHAGGWEATQKQQLNCPGHWQPLGTTFFETSPLGFTRISFWHIWCWKIRRSLRNSPKRGASQHSRASWSGGQQRQHPLRSENCSILQRLCGYSLPICFHYSSSLFRKIAPCWSNLRPSWVRQKFSLGVGTKRMRIYWFRQDLWRDFVIVTKLSSFYDKGQTKSYCKMRHLRLVRRQSQLCSHRDHKTKRLTRGRGKDGFNIFWQTATGQDTREQTQKATEKQLTSTAVVFGSGGCKGDAPFDPHLDQQLPNSCQTRTTCLDNKQPKFHLSRQFLQHRCSQTTDTTSEMHSPVHVQLVIGFAFWVHAELFNEAPLV